MRRCLDCPRIVATGNRCIEHERARERKRGTRQQRGYDAGWMEVRIVVLERDGYQCRLRRPGCIGVATTVDHVTPLAVAGRTLDPDQLVAACLPCNSGKRDRAT